MLLVTLKILVKNPALFKAPQGKKPPPLWIRSILILTCTGVSFAHGSNDGQKGMGLIMLILIGTVPTVYALNRAMEPDRIQAFSGDGQAVTQVLSSRVPAQPATATTDDEARGRVAAYVRTQDLRAGHAAGADPDGPRRSTRRRPRTRPSPTCRRRRSATSATTCTSSAKRSGIC